MSGAQRHLIRVDPEHVVQIRGRKLLEAVSDRGGAGCRDRWIELTLYHSVEELLVLVVRYESVTSGPEPEAPHTEVVKLKSWEDLGRCLDTYDFMRFVHLDHHCDGHCSLMSGAGIAAARLRLHFRATALDFFRACLAKRSEWDLPIW